MATTAVAASEMACTAAPAASAIVSATSATAATACSAGFSAWVSTMPPFFWPSAPFSRIVLPFSCSAGFLADSALGAAAALGAVALLVWQPMMCGLDARRAGLQRNEAWYSFGLSQ